MTTLETLKQNEREAQRAYSKGTGSLEAAQEAGRAVHQFRDRQAEQQRQAEAEAIQSRYDAAMLVVGRHLYRVATSEPGFFSVAMGDDLLGVPCWHHGEGYNVLFCVLRDAEKARGLQGVRSVSRHDAEQDICFSVNVQGDDDSMDILEAAAAKVLDSAD